MKLPAVAGLVLGVRSACIYLGGSAVLGGGLATAARLLLSAAVLLAPTVLMGGTLPAAARAVQSAQDAGRRSLGLLYGANTLGAFEPYVPWNREFLELRARTYGEAGYPRTALAERRFVECLSAAGLRFGDTLSAR
ncbi:MAG: hypothetical protein BWZ09_02751 [Alphaproteobacteria bacterium ADurb.BinA305]|nr:MAG: hypothetical protein BWZ09_02751 [Alphaproteobacteria bacterium ADurb.BinA305]